MINLGLVLRQAIEKCSILLLIFNFLSTLKAANGHDECAESLLRREADALCR